MVLLCLLGGCRDHSAEIQAAYAAYQKAVAAGDGTAALAVTDSSSVAYWGSYFREHALSRNREELANRSLWEQVVILVYRDQLGGDFLRSATPEQVYEELVRRRLLIRSVEGYQLGIITIKEERRADAEMLQNGAPSGYMIGFELEEGKWKIITHDNAGYVYHQLREVSKKSGVLPEAVIRTTFKLFTGHEPNQTLNDPP